MCITGGLGIPGSARERTSSRNALAGVFMGFSITSAVLGGIIIIFYKKHSYRGKMAILASMLVLGSLTFGAGIWAAICTCLMKPCGCCGQPPQMYGYPASGYAMSAGGVPVAIPMQAMQAGASGAAAQGYHQPMVLVPVSGAAGGQQLIAQATSPGGIVTGTLQQQQMEAGMSHSFVDTRGYAAKPNEQMQVAV
ncbi:unnamed protein product [Porites lobata]|uniref:Uncharacterized protein n=1 Tax=Porites lobata TaxID=104759 RepID=A0ABN8Q119_9CNID|nr:unnamed protein product [Porites lobata]